MNDYWGAELPVNVGQNNFDAIRYEYFRDRQVAFEAFKGGAFTFREEFTARVWATGYDFPAVAEGRVRRACARCAPLGHPGLVDQHPSAAFSDPRVREAIGLCFDFTWTNKNLMYGAYMRTASYFENSDLKATGRPSPEELALLDPLRASLPAEVFGEPWSPPKSTVRARTGRCSAAPPPSCARPAAPATAGSCGCPAASPWRSSSSTSTRPPAGDPALHPQSRADRDPRRIRLVDPSQYQSRVNDFDFDLTVRRFAIGLTPGPELREAYGSRAAATPGSNNLAGIADPGHRRAHRRVTEATSRADMVHACRALDRVLRAGQLLGADVVRGHPPDRGLGRLRPPGQGPGLRSRRAGAWWFDAAKARRIGRI